MKKFLLTLIICFCINSCLSGLWGSVTDYVEDIFGERCSKHWIPSDLQGLRSRLESKVFGQPFLKKALIPLLERHFGQLTLNPNYIPRKALVMSFHGGPGVGKTFVTEQIAEFMFKNGAKSRHYKLFTLGGVTSDQAFKERVIREVKESVKQCELSIFVFDEIEKMPVGTFDLLKPFLDFHPMVDNIDFRKATFIFVSNIGTNIINNVTIAQWQNGLKREDYILGEFEDQLFLPVYNEKSALSKSRIVKNFLIDVYLPFLPLEKDHVRQCIRAEVENLEAYLTKYQHEALQEKVLKNLKFLPEDKELYSFSGCKTVDSEVLHNIDIYKSEL